MQFRRTYNVIKLEEPWPARCGEPEKLFGLEEVVDDKVRKIIGKDWRHDAFVTEEEAQKVADEKNNKFYLSDYSNQEIKDFFDAIDFEPVYAKLRKIVGRKDLTFKKTLEIDRSGMMKYFSIEGEQNLAENNKLLRAAWKDFRVSTFSAEIFLDYEGNLNIWGNFDYSYAHQDGGHNGAHILDFTYGVADGWDMTSAEERRKFNEKQK